MCVCVRYSFFSQNVVWGYFRPRTRKIKKKHLLRILFFPYHIITSISNRHIKHIISSILASRFIKRIHFIYLFDSEWNVTWKSFFSLARVLARMVERGGSWELSKLRLVDCCVTKYRVHKICFFKISKKQQLFMPQKRRTRSKTPVKKKISGGGVDGSGTKSINDDLIEKAKTRFPSIRKVLQPYAESDSGPRFFRQFRCSILDFFFKNFPFLGNKIQYLILLPLVSWIVDPGNMTRLTTSILLHWFVATFLGTS